ncbi:hypothetical protein KBI51_05860 [Aerococcaceae bacterium zg-ZUI334]|uniref:Rgg family transcriptional regulator n=1 Tax=Aerococcaceae bacterium zg-252 TaxID=2796928 RepID=UPI001B9EB7CA|nr:hypothetical protein [Aerococcaceae bacterium zg-ZUI334]
MDNLGLYFRIIRESKNISLSSLADDQISKGMLSKFERGDSDISITRFFHLLEKIKVSPNEFFFLKNQYKADGFEEILSTIQASALSGNTKKLVLLLDMESKAYSAHGDKYNQLNIIMIKAVLYGMGNSDYKLNSQELDYILDYLFRCENWGLYELILYGNSMGALPLESVISFSKSVPQKILLMTDSGKMLEIGFNVILNSLSLCIENNYRESAQYFVTSLESLELPEVMLFENTLLRLYKGAFLKKFNINIAVGNQLIEDSLSIFRLANCLDLHDLFSKNIAELLV